MGTVLSQPMLRILGPLGFLVLVSTNAHVNAAPAAQASRTDLRGRFLDGPHASIEAFCKLLKEGAPRPVVDDVGEDLTGSLCDSEINCGSVAERLVAGQVLELRPVGMNYGLRDKCLPALRTESGWFVDVGTRWGTDEHHWTDVRDVSNRAEASFGEPALVVRRRDGHDFYGEEADSAPSQWDSCCWESLDIYGVGHSQRVSVITLLLGHAGLCQGNDQPAEVRRMPPLWDILLDPELTKDGRLTLRVSRQTRRYRPGPCTRRSSSAFAERKEVERARRQAGTHRLIFR